MNRTRSNLSEKNNGFEYIRIAAGKNPKNSKSYLNLRIEEQMYTAQRKYKEAAITS